MRDLVLNEVSLQASGMTAAIDWTSDITVGLACLIKHRCANSTIRSKRQFHDILINEKVTMYDVLVAMRKAGNVEAFRFLGGLASKTPLTKDLPEATLDRFLRCEESSLSEAEGGPLLLCVHGNSILVSFPSTPTWDNDIVNVHFNEMQSNLTFLENEERIDNLSRSVHSTSVIQRHRQRIRDDIKNVRDIWDLRSEAFPSLLFGLDVPSQLAHVQNGMVQTIVARLSDLDLSTSEWRQARSPLPQWKCKVTPESSSLMDNPKLRAERCFRSEQGGSEIFEWHARCGSGYRIHLRFDRQNYLVEIGYVGFHLSI